MALIKNKNRRKHALLERNFNMIISVDVDGNEILTEIDEYCDVLDFMRLSEVEKYYKKRLISETNNQRDKIMRKLPNGIIEIIEGHINEQYVPLLLAAPALLEALEILWKFVKDTTHVDDYPTNIAEKVRKAIAIATIEIEKD